MSRASTPPQRRRPPAPNCGRSSTPAALSVETGDAIIASPVVAPETVDVCARAQSDAASALPSIGALAEIPRMTDVVALAAELLTIESTSGTEGKVVDFVSRWLVSRGWNVSLQQVSAGRANVWAS